MTKDRTKAIVEAAERLAKAMNLDVSPHGCARYDMSLEDGLTPEADDALLVLARALALPASPPVPEAKLRAVYDAASALACALDLRVDDSGRVESEPSDTAFCRPEECLALVRALALPAEPATAWTKTPPSEPGWYWTLCRTDLSPRPFLARINDAGLWHVEESEFSIPLDDVENWEWWPVRLQEPPA